MERDFLTQSSTGLPDHLKNRIGDDSTLEKRLTKVYNKGVKPEEELKSLGISFAVVLMNPLTHLQLALNAGRPAENLSGALLTVLSNVGLGLGIFQYSRSSLFTRKVRERGIGQFLDSEGIGQQLIPPYPPHALMGLIGRQL